MKSDEAEAAPATSEPNVVQPEPHPLDVVDLDALSGGRDPSTNGGIRPSDTFW